MCMNRGFCFPKSQDMSNVLCVAWRTPGLGLRASSLLPPNATAPFRSIGRHSSPAWLLDSISRRFLNSSSLFTPLPFRLRRPEAPCPPSPSQISARFFQNSAGLLSQKVPPPEHGVKLRDEPFSKAEIDAIFGTRAKISLAMGNRALSVLQGRRLDGTLDLDFPADITRAVRAAGLDAGLKYLRENYPIDEDAAIMARIEREEREEETKLIRRAEELGLYKPQSGSYGAELGEGDDPSGRSVLKEYRKQNEERLLAEAERKRQEWLEGEEKDREKWKQQMEKNTSLQKYEDTSALEVKERADPTQRPVLAWIQKHHLRATNYEMDVTQLTTRRRILPALGFTLLTLGLCYAFAANYEPPAKADRMWPDLPPAAATAVAIIGANVGIFVLWKAWPPAWRLLNRYFISVAAYPRPFSLIGNVFSHQTVRHIATNMALIWFVGTKLHDEIGRGNFLALYMAAGVIGSFTSLTIHVLTNKLFITSLGASGAVSGLVAALCMIHSNEKLTIAFLPREWQDTISAPGWVFLAGLVTFEVLSMVFPFRMATLDHWAHLGGYLTGTLWAVNWKEKERIEREKNKTWLDKVFG
ncbi:hypothetical protein ARAM_004180 [Aspergillus rambellii]|uniref:Peptidase S54 rhomboid domain-containing protein n=2 Tax=Aspergillus subgen. Nidulantes TaxID=2720870 RepID=A0A0F8V149_9EURO|nr:hypothetical protein ARAM_004180 [Aspergillus rambellii]